MHLDRAQTLGARRLHIVDAIGARDNTLNRRSDEAANQIGAGADIDRCDLHHGNIAAWILTYAQRADGLQSGDQDHQINHDRQYRTLNK